MAEATETRTEEVLQEFRRRLHDAGLKSTWQRDVIARAFFRLDKHISVDELLAEVREESPRVGYATVYRTLKLLVEHSLANPRHFDDGQTRYDPQFFKEQHDHLICVDCRRILEFDNEEIVDLIHAQASKLGFTVTRRSLEIYGNCNTADCPHRAARGG